MKKSRKPTPAEQAIIEAAQRLLSEDPFAPAELTPQQQRDWEVSLALCLAATPAFATPLYELLSWGDHLALFTKGVPIAATDATALLLNPDTFFTFDPGERLFIMGHEILHVLLFHVFIMHELQRTGFVSYPDGVKISYDHGLGNIAADYVVNAILVEGKIGKYNKNWYYDPAIATAANSFFDTYRKLVQQFPTRPPEGWTGPGSSGAGKPVQGQQPQGGTQPPPPAQPPSTPIPGAAKGQSAFDRHLKPGTVKKITPEQAKAEASGPKHRRIIEQALDMAREQGQLPDSVARALGKVIEPEVDWTEKLGTTVSRRIGNDRWNYEVPNQEWMARDIFVPSRSSFGCADLVVGGDVSGSVTDEEHDLMKGAMVGILEQLRPKRLFAVWCDAKVQQVDLLDAPSDLYTLKPPKGGGGTDFRPVFKWIADNPDLELDGLIYLTDGFGTYPSVAPAFPVIWGSVTRGKIYPFGDVIEIPRKGTPRRRW